MNTKVDSPADDTVPAAADFSKGYANYVLGVLVVVYIFNFIDRQVMSVFIGPIKEEFGATDTQMGLLVGFAFALLYTVAGIPIARLADRFNRRNIIAIGLTAWSAMTVLSGMARSFTQLAIARVGVGIGEAAGSPPAHSLIADYFPIERRATALAIYTSGAFIGSAIAFWGGGFMREHFDWRTAFIVLGAPGLLVALVLRFTVREPQRGVSDQRQDDETSTLMETLRYLASRRSWVLLMAGYSLLSLTGYAVLMWGYEFYARAHSMTLSEIGFWMGLVVGVGGTLGSILGGQLSDRVARSSAANAIRLPTLVTLAGLPVGMVCVWTESVTLSLACFFPFFLLLNIYIPPMFSANQALARLRMRATAAAIMLFIGNIVGAGFGPLLVGALSDYFSADYGQLSIRYALLCAIAIGVIGALLMLSCTRWIEADLKKVEG